MNTAGLSLEQAPPISIPFRFFLTAAFFGFAASISILFLGPELFITRWSPLTVGLTHAFTLGVVAMVMCGAMTQMLPVLAGSPLPKVQWVGPAVHLLLSLGTLAFVYGFIVGGKTELYWGVGCLVLGLSIFIVSVGVALWRIQNPSNTIVGMRLSVVSLLITMLLGAARASGLLDSLGFGSIAMLIDVHLGWGLLGWVGLLAMGVSYQIVPMFMVTPDYPEKLSRWLLPLIFLILLVWGALKLAGASGLVPTSVPSTLLFLIAACLALFALLTLKVQSQRKRKVPDISMMFWKISMVSILLSACLWMGAQIWPEIGQAPRYPLVLGITMILGGACALVNGMLYKIVPFLSWFHLQNMQMKQMCFSVQIPNMKQFIPDKYARGQFYLFLWAYLLSLLAAINPLWFVYPAAVLLGLSFLALFINLARAMLRFRKTYQRLLDEGEPSAGGVGGTEL